MVMKARDAGDEAAGGRCWWTRCEVGAWGLLFGRVVKEGDPG